MRSVRCDDCGTKALMAASKCPKCGHPFAVRDGFGELLPLSHCSTCNSDYPASSGSCKWCGTMPERAPITPRVWKGVGIVAFVGMAWGAWMVHDDEPARAASTSRLQDLLKPDSAALSPDSARALQSLAIASTVDTGRAAANAIDSSAINAVDPAVRDNPTSVVATDSSVLPMLAGGGGRDSIVSVQSAGTVAEPEPTAVADSTPEVVPVAREAVRDPARPPARERARDTARVTPRESARAAVRAAPPATRDVARAPARVSTRPSAAAPKTATRATARADVRPPGKVAPRVAAAPKASSRSSRTARWTTSVARSWVVVRADPNRRSRIIASIGPNTRVQLGESRGEWRRVKAKGLSGWVEHRSFLARLPLAKKAGRLAAR